tara:strand:- start:33873 stop:34529 length:657 start_codon:yes stop_codon:yes gene_type:complete
MPNDLGYPALGWSRSGIADTGEAVLQQVAQPSVEPITLLEARAHLKVDATAEDALIYAWIQAARQHVEGATRRAMLPQDWELRLSSFPRRGEAVDLPLPPFIAVLSVSTYDAAGEATLIAADGYQVEAPGGDFAPSARMYPGSAGLWPVAVAGVRGAIRIRYRAGYFSPGAVPAPLRAAMFLIIGDLYENREGSLNRNIQTNPTVERLVDPFRLPRVR